MIVIIIIIVIIFTIIIIIIIGASRDRWSLRSYCNDCGSIEDQSTKFKKKIT